MKNCNLVSVTIFFELILWRWGWAREKWRVTNFNGIEIAI